MLEMIGATLLVLWLLGVVSGDTLGHAIYVLLVVALALWCWRDGQSAERRAPTDLRPAPSRSLRH